MAPISSTNTKRPASTSPATKALQAALRNSSRSVAPRDLFSCSTPALEHPRERRVTHPHPRGPRQELAPLGQGGRRAFLDVRLQEPPRPFVHLRLRAGAPLGGQGAARPGGRHVALDGRDADAEGAGDLGLGRAALDGLDDLLAQVFGVGVHGRMVPCRPATLQDALRDRPKSLTNELISSPSGGSSPRR